MSANNTSAERESTIRIMRQMLKSGLPVKGGEQGAMRALVALHKSLMLVNTKLGDTSETLFYEQAAKTRSDLASMLHLKDVQEIVQAHPCLQEATDDEITDEMFNSLLADLDSNLAASENTLDAQDATQSGPSEVSSEQSKSQDQPSNVNETSEKAADVSDGTETSPKPASLTTVEAAGKEGPAEQDETGEDPQLLSKTTVEDAGKEGSTELDSTGEDLRLPSKTPETLNDVQPAVTPDWDETSKDHEEAVETHQNAQVPDNKKQRAAKAGKKPSVPSNVDSRDSEEILKEFAHTVDANGERIRRTWRAAKNVYMENPAKGTQVTAYFSTVEKMCDYCRGLSTAYACVWTAQSSGCERCTIQRQKCQGSAPLATSDRKPYISEGIPADVCKEFPGVKEDNRPSKVGSRSRKIAERDVEVESGRTRAQKRPRLASPEATSLTNRPGPAGGTRSKTAPIERSALAARGTRGPTTAAYIGRNPRSLQRPLQRTTSNIGEQSVRAYTFDTHGESVLDSPLPLTVAHHYKATASLLARLEADIATYTSYSAKLRDDLRRMEQFSMDASCTRKELEAAMTGAVPALVRAADPQKPDTPAKTTANKTNVDSDGNTDGRQVEGSEHSDKLDDVNMHDVDTAEAE